MKKRGTTKPWTLKVALHPSGVLLVNLLQGVRLVFVDAAIRLCSMSSA